MAGRLKTRKAKLVGRTTGKTRTFLETKRFSQGVKVRIPVLTVTGAKPGPRAVIMACQHGRELNGIAAAERVFNQLDPAKLAGEVVFLPVITMLPWALSEAFTSAVPYGLLLSASNRSPTVSLPVDA